MIVVLEGSGTTPGEALKDAFHQAVELVTGIELILKLVWSLPVPRGERPYVQ